MSLFARFLYGSLFVAGMLGCCLPSSDGGDDKEEAPNIEAEPMAQAPDTSASEPAGDEPQPAEGQVLLERMLDALPPLPVPAEEAKIGFLSVSGLRGALITKSKSLPKCKDKDGWGKGEWSSGAISWVCLKLDPKFSDLPGVEIVTREDGQTALLMIQSEEPGWKDSYLKSSMADCHDAKPETPNMLFSCPDRVIMSFTDKSILVLYTRDSFETFRSILIDSKWDEGPKFGEAMRLGDFSYTILSGRRASQIGESFSRVKAATGGSFVIVKYRIENMANETKTVMTDDFQLKDYKGRTFRPSANANTTLAIEEGGELILRELQPGLAVERSTAFEVPLDALKRPEVMTLIIPEKGFKGTDSVSTEIWFPR